MKKIVVATLASIYLFTSIGASVELHYCMGKFADGSLWHSKSSKCSICGMQKKANKGCCRDEYKLAKIEQDQRAPENLGEPDRKLSHVLPIIFPLRISLSRSIAPCPSNADGPERSSPYSLHQLNCILRI